MTEEKKPVIVVDDSPVVRTLLKHIIDGSPEFYVAAQAGDGLEAVAFIKKMRPAVVTMDVQMPRMDGPSAIKEIMRDCPTPIIVCSVLAVEGAPVVLRSLEYGAFDFVTKPRSVMSDPNLFAAVLLGKLRAALTANRASLAAAPGDPLPASDEPEPAAAQETGSATASRQPTIPAAVPSGFEGSIPAEVVVFGSSTGGPKAILSILPGFPRDFAPAVIVALQDVPGQILKLIADQLSKVCALPVEMATTERPVMGGKILLIGAESHAMLIRGAETEPRLKLLERQLATEQSPSLNGLFSSIAVACPGRCIGILLTGTGKDGALGLKKIRQAGGRTMVEDKRTAVVYDKPAAAIALDIVDMVLPSQKIVEAILQVLACAPAAVAVLSH